MLEGGREVAAHISDTLYISSLLQNLYVLSLIFIFPTWKRALPIYFKQEQLPFLKKGDSESCMDVVWELRHWWKA